MNTLHATAWAVEWHSRNRLDGETRDLVLENGLPVLFCTRQKTRDWIEQKFGYIRQRPDLLAEPHGWRMPRPVKVVVARVSREREKKRDHGLRRSAPATCLLGNGRTG